MAKAREIELADGTVIPILYEDRSVLVLDKPAGWLMIPTSWEKTARNLQLALESSINARDFWARSRNIKFLRFVHRLDADTSGVVVFGNPGPPISLRTDRFTLTERSVVSECPFRPPVLMAVAVTSGLIGYAAMFRLH